MGRCDSFVVETDVHYPTDINLLFDAIRKMIQLVAIISQDQGLSIWRQHEYNIRSFKKRYRQTQRLRHSNSKDEKKRSARQQLITDAYSELIETAEAHIRKTLLTISRVDVSNPISMAKIIALKEYIAHANRQIDQIRRRVLQGEKIPHCEKVFSIFEPHTEWISKGKAGVPQELGLKVCVLEDQYGLILHHRVMVKETDDKIAITMVNAAQLKFPALRGCSFDKGFYTPTNKIELKDMLNSLVMPKKGRRNKTELEEEKANVFIQSKRKHSAVESAINGLENHGLDRCLDHGLHGFKKYVSLAILARNIQIIGHHIQQKELKRLQRAEALEAA